MSLFKKLKETLFFYQAACQGLVLCLTEVRSQQSDHLLQLFANHFKEKLTPKELACASLLSKNHGCKKVASHMNISVRTLKQYVVRVKQKLQCRGLNELFMKLHLVGCNNLSRP